MKNYHKNIWKIVKKYLKDLFMCDFDMVIGGHGKGLMGLSYNIAKENNREVFLICIEKHKSNRKDSKETVVTDVSSRVSELINLSDAFIILPGGIGSMSELFSILETKRSGEFDKPIIIYNSKGFYNKFIDFLSKLNKQNFISSKDFNMIHISNNASDTIEYLKNYPK